jgi:hypothetical protein
MANTEKKRAREQNAAARRDRVAQKRIEKAAVSGGPGESYWEERVETPEPTEEAARPAD